MNYGGIGPDAHEKRDTADRDGSPERGGNIVLIGMPGSGKSTLAALLGRKLGRPVANVDDLVRARAGMSIREIFARYGEARFRDLESEVVVEVGAKRGQIVATGGGTVLRRQNVEALRRNGRLFLLDRPLEALTPSEERPLGDTREKLARLYRERMPVYRAAADEVVPVSGTPEETASLIESRCKE